MAVLRVAAVAALFALATSQAQDVQQLDAEIEMGFGHLKKHIHSFSDDMKSWFRNAAGGQAAAETEQEIKADMSAEVRKLRQA